MELHLVAGKGAGFVGKDVMNQAKILNDAHIAHTRGFDSLLTNELDIAYDEVSHKGLDEFYRNEK